ncbi:MAG: protein YgfX [Gammaproteobacteria bacterium]
MSYNFALKTSWFLGVCLVLIYGGGLFLGAALWWRLPSTSLSIFLVFLMTYSFYSFCYTWRHFVTKVAKTAILNIGLENQQWIIQTRDGECWQGELMPGSVVVPPVLFLRFQSIYGREKQVAIVTADSLSLEKWHQCCQCLRVMSIKDPSLFH